MTDSPLGFPPQPRAATFVNLMKSLRGEADTARTEAVTGRMSDIAGGLGGSVAEAIDLEKRLGDLDAYATAIGLAQARADALQASLGAVVSTVTDVANAAQTALSANTPAARATAAQEAKDALAAITGALNISFAGRGLFAGDVADAGALASPAEIQTAVATLAGAAPDATIAEATIRSAFDDPLDPNFLYDASGIYFGGAGDAPAVEVAPGERVAYHAKADEGPIRDVVRHLASLHFALDQGTPAIMSEDQRLALAESSVAGLRDTLDGLNQISARIGSSEARMETVRVRQAAEETRLTAGYNDLTGRDTLASAARMQELEGQLETLFLTTARLSQLSLANFLR